MNQEQQPFPEHLPTSFDSTTAREYRKTLHEELDGPELLPYQILRTVLQITDLSLKASQDRPQETPYLLREDYLTGLLALKKSKGYDRQQHGDIFEHFSRGLLANEQRIVQQMQPG